MKKKGLIIATIVMVLVLAVSLTTATYAWFSSTASATIDSVTLVAQAADGLLIGAKGVASSPTNTYTDYRYGTVIWDGSSNIWSGDSYMGTNLSFNTAADTPMSISNGKAVSYTASAINNTGAEENVTIPANSWFAANGTTAASYDKKTAEAASAQVNYVDLDLAVTASKANSVKQAYMTVLVRPTAGVALKMAAAIHFYIAVTPVNDGTPGAAVAYTDAYATAEHTGLSAYEGKVQSNNFSGSVSKGHYVSSTLANGTVDTKHDVVAGDWYFVVPLYNSNTFMTPYTDLIQIKLMMWIEGTDDACIVANAGTGADVLTYFDYNDKYDTTGALVFNAGTGASYTGIVSLHA